jgi:hypothetical protein
MGNGRSSAALSPATELGELKVERALVSSTSAAWSILRAR